MDAHIGQLGSTAERVQPSTPAVFPRLLPALEELWRSAAYAQQLQCDHWDFAVEIATLRSFGLTNSDLRWLVLAGFVEHARDVTPVGEDGRQFRATGNLRFTNRSSFVLTARGRQAAAEAGITADVWEAFDSLRPRTAEATPYAENGKGHRNGRTEIVLPSSPTATSLEPPVKPQWDPDRHELRVGRELVKVYKLPSPNQETILTAFEEEGWPPRVDDPLPPVLEMDSQRRLHDTIRSLNRKQKSRLLKFMGDGTGQGVRWEFLTPPEGSRQ
ncbi:MAG: hypothetical protein KY476_25415 [Planctomycetes bacterium]|nr:hypothetical protein [Planctomycetota bacterium]